MRYKDQIPQELFINPNLVRLVDTLDAIEQYKESLVEKSSRFYRPPTLGNLQWLRKKVEDYGYPPVPTAFTKEQLDAMLLNSQSVMALRGSKLGLRYFLWVLTFGEITIDDSAFYPDANYIIPGDLDQGYVSHVIPEQTYDLFLFNGDSTNYGTQVLNIAISTKYYNMVPMQQYILQHIKDFLSFTDSNAQINIVYSPGIYNTFSDPYQYFIIP